MISSPPFLKSEQTYYFRASKLSHFPICPKRSKLESWRYLPWEEVESRSGVLRKGNELHYIYSVPYKSWDRRLLREQLLRAYGLVFQKQTGNIVVRGTYDDLRVLSTRNGKVVSLIELKTTSKKRLWQPEIESAMFQLQIYVWLMREAIEALGWRLHSRHYLEIVSQKTGRLIERILVREDPQIEEKIKFILRVFQGLERAQVPPDWICRTCPRHVKKECDWYKMRKEREKVTRYDGHC